MGRPTATFRPALDRLEDRRLLNAGPPAHAAHHPADGPPPPQAHHPAHVKPHHPHRHHHHRPGAPLPGIPANPPPPGGHAPAPPAVSYQLAQGGPAPTQAAIADDFLMQAPSTLQPGNVYNAKFVIITNATSGPPPLGAFSATDTNTGFGVPFPGGSPAFGPWNRGKMLVFFTLSKSPLAQPNYVFYVGGQNYPSVSYGVAGGITFYPNNLAATYNQLNANLVNSPGRWTLTG